MCVFECACVCLSVHVCVLINLTALSAYMNEWLYECGTYS